MAERSFMEMLKAKWAEGKFVCVGLDSDFVKIPGSVQTGVYTTTIRKFNTAIVDATKDLVCVYKPNIAFYLAHGEAGLYALRETILYIQKVAPDVPVILDAKVADIGNTNAGYVKEAFEILQADAITVHPYLGAEALQPFLDRKDKGVIVLCKTSNPGAGEFQDWDISGDVVPHPHYMPLYKYVAYRVRSEWNKNGNCALVVGATYPGQLKEVRETVGDTPILIPGVGFQQKGVPIETQVQQVVEAGMDSRGEGMIINSSRGIIFASKGSDFAEAARRETENLHELIQTVRVVALEGRSGG